MHAWAPTGTHWRAHKFRTRCAALHGLSSAHRVHGPGTGHTARVPEQGSAGPVLPAPARAEQDLDTPSESPWWKKHGVAQV